VALTNQRNGMLQRWEERWEHLQLILEVYQFARDAAVAEAWLVAQEPYLLSQELGHHIDEVENLIKKHEAFEKSASAQEERFTALERLTTYELRDRDRREREEEDRRRAEELAKKTPPKSPESDRPDGARSPEQTSERETLSHRESASTKTPPPTPTRFAGQGGSLKKKPGTRLFTSRPNSGVSTKSRALHHICPCLQYEFGKYQCRCGFIDCCFDSGDHHSFSSGFHSSEFSQTRSSTSSPSKCSFNLNKSYDQEYVTYKSSFRRRDTRDLLPVELPVWNDPFNFSKTNHPNYSCRYIPSTYSNSPAYYGNREHIISGFETYFNVHDFEGVSLPLFWRAIWLTFFGFVLYTVVAVTFGNN